MKKIASDIADEIIAGIIVIGCFILLAMRIDGEVKSILTMSVGYIFVKRATRFTHKNK